MAMSRIDLCSRALLKTGAHPIGSFAEGTAEADVASNLYDYVRDALLSAHPWHFATTQKKLAALPLTPEGAGSAYALPADCLRVLHAGSYEGGSGLVYRLSNRTLHTEATEIFLTYVFRADELSAVLRQGPDCTPRGRILHSADRQHHALGGFAEDCAGRPEAGQAHQRPAGDAGAHRRLLPRRGAFLMARVRSVKTSFSAGELSPRLLGRTDLRAFENGAARLRNVFIHPTGGVSRRPGLRFVDTARGRGGRLIPAEFRSDEVYLLVLTNRLADVYRNGVRVAGFPTPWSAEQLAQVNWVQSPDVLLVVHPDVPPQKIVRRGITDWTIASWTFSQRDGRICCPHRKFADEQVTLKATSTTGTVTVTASASVFKAGHVGVRFRIANREVVVTEVVSDTQARVDVKQTLASTQATEDWSEEAFSAVRGWPAAVCYHQDRLVIGGSRDLANRLWMSRTSQPFDFDLGDRLDDQGIEFSILSDQLNAIRAVFSGRHLQVFTSGAEWMVSGDPLTPTNIQLHRQTRAGSIVTRTVAPKDIDGATVFVARSQKQIREFLFAETEQAYQANDLSLLADHLIDHPVEMDLDQASRLLHVVMANGTMATLTIYRNEQMSAWTLQETQGSFRSVAAVGEDTYVLVERSGGSFIEVFDNRLSVDAGRLATAASPQVSWPGFDYLDGQAVKVTADAVVRADTTVAGGRVILDVAARTCAIGLGYTHVIEPLPVVAPGSGVSGVGTRLRPVAVTLRLLETAALYLDTGRGLVDIPFRRFRSGSLEGQTSRFTGDITVRAYGWRADASSGLWRIVQSAPLPFTLLSVATEISAS